MVTEVNLRLAFRSKKTNTKIMLTIQFAVPRVGSVTLTVADARNSGGYVLSCFAFLTVFVYISTLLICYAHKRTDSGRIICIFYSSKFVVETCSIIV